MSAESLARAHVQIVGRVQGVGFRYAVQSEARRQRVAGWVRNLDSGAVEAVFEGSRDAVDAIVRWCADGPPGAHVRECRAAWDEPPEHLADFSVWPTISCG